MDFRESQIPNLGIQRRYHSVEHPTSISTNQSDANDQVRDVHTVEGMFKTRFSRCSVAIPGSIQLYLETRTTLRLEVPNCRLGGVADNVDEMVLFYPS
jgi:hypothetical protein